MKINVIVVNFNIKPLSAEPSRKLSGKMKKIFNCLGFKCERAYANKYRAKIRLFSDR